MKSANFVFLANAIALSLDDDDDDEDDDDDDDDEEDDEEEAKPKDAKMEVDGGKSLNFGAIRKLIGLVLVLMQVVNSICHDRDVYVRRLLHTCTSRIMSFSFSHDRSTPISLQFV